MVYTLQRQPCLMHSHTLWWYILSNVSSCASLPLSLLGDVIHVMSVDGTMCFFSGRARCNITLTWHCLARPACCTPAAASACQSPSSDAAGYGEVACEQQLSTQCTTTCLGACRSPCHLPDQGHPAVVVSPGPAQRPVWKVYITILRHCLFWQR